MALFLQEPWTTPYNWLPPTQQNRHIYTSRTTPTNSNKKPRVCIYINRSIPTPNIFSIPSNNNFINWVTINHSNTTIPRITLLSVYNTPTKLYGLPHLQTWHNNMSNSDTPTFLMI
ncbi:hypothetical protein O181_024163 [Austropuccinia psidii MF-1]|uniref:Uncharacterized protein n=1 Tax=Austropuccinia psidii MF-1 TaxID=1389203 RepID=A0A9Q3GXY9_9BASI|nr:hypothetical protein [Austropuccinia psidii MF-1]